MEKSKAHLFITGKAGTGKSTLLEYFHQNTKKKPVILAPTGVAAINVKGQTIHSFFNFYIDITPQKILHGDVKVNKKDHKLYKKLKTIIIDEVSMVRADLLDCIDAFLCRYGPHPTEPFGGVQMIFVGDLYQLPPVVIRQDRELFASYYRTPYFFSAKVMDNLPLEHIELEKVYRQKNTDFIALLNRIRNNSLEDSDIARLNERYQPNDEIKSEQCHIHLTTTNRKADEINALHLDALKGKPIISTATITGLLGKEYYPTATELSYKIGAQIMLLNNDPKRRWVNGTIGQIKAIKKDKNGDQYLRVQLQDSQ
ncbi:MAG: AAA family ATPase, partial [Gammaproteobacteria bacterium]|nr:AAA family ATPase [Gammaproteobacteria bacterium]